MEQGIEEKRFNIDEFRNINECNNNDSAGGDIDWILW